MLTAGCSLCRVIVMLMADFCLPCSSVVAGRCLPCGSDVDGKRLPCGSDVDKGVCLPCDIDCMCLFAMWH